MEYCKLSGLFSIEALDACKMIVGLDNLRPGVREVSSLIMIMDGSHYIVWMI